MDLPAYRWRFVHLAALWGYGVSQPVFSALKGNPELLYLHGTGRTEAIVFAVLLAFVPPLVVVALEVATGLVSRTLSDTLHIVAVWGVAFLAVLQAPRDVVHDQAFNVGRDEDVVQIRTVATQVAEVTGRPVTFAPGAGPDARNYRVDFGKIRALLPAADQLMSAGARTADIGHFVHHQNADKYDVLRSNPTMLATEQRISSADFDRLHTIATKFYRLVIIDSGNDESAERWLRMIDHTDQLVIATTALGEHAEAGALLLEALMQRDAQSARLARDAVVIVSQSERTGPASDVRRVAAGFEPLARRAVTIPFDPEMHGGRLSFDTLAPRTRRAWLHAAAAVAEGL